MAEQSSPTVAWDEEMSRAYGLIYDKKSSAFGEDLCTVWRSMCKESLQRTKKTDRSAEDLACPTLHWHGAIEHGRRKGLADVHHERALNAGKLSTDNGRRWRRKRYHKSKQEQSKGSE